MTVWLMTLAVWFTLPTAAAADADGPGDPVSVNLSAYSQYVFRGLTQTRSRPAFQWSVDYTPPSGLYAGTWMSNISWFSDSNPGTSTPVEWDVYGGYRRGLGSGFSVDAGVMRYAYPGRYGPLPEGTANPNMTEFYVAVSWRAASVKYSHAVTNTNGVEHSVGSSYLDLTVTAPLGEAVSATFHVGRQAFRGGNVLTESLGTTNSGLYTYDDYAAGLTLSFGKACNASIAYMTTTARDAGYVVLGRNLGSPHLIAGLTHTF